MSLTGEIMSDDTYFEPPAPEEEAGRSKDMTTYFKAVHPDGTDLHTGTAQEVTREDR